MSEIKNKYLICTWVGGLMEHEGREWFEDKQVIEAFNKEEAIYTYNKLNNKSFFSGHLLASYENNDLTINNSKGVSQEDLNLLVNN